MMGTTWEVTVWKAGDDHWRHQTYWMGNNIFTAVYAYIKAMHSGSGCVSLVWRG